MRHFICFRFALALLCLCCVSAANAQAPSGPPPQDINAVGLTLDEVIDRLETIVVGNNDTAEGRGKSSVQRMRALWPARVTHNTDSNVNMFGEYFLALKDAAQARFAGPCASTTAFEGAWKCIGPNGLTTQHQGYVECLWVHPANADTILAGTYGGIFKSTDRGLSWRNITDNVHAAFGIFSVNTIAVHPTDPKIIYASTGYGDSFWETGALNGSGGFMAGALLKSTDGGATWTQEVVGTTGQPGDYLHRLQMVRFTPDGNHIICLRMDRIFIRPTNGTASSWTEITSSTNNPLISLYGEGAHQWRDIEFVPNAANNSDFFYAATANFGGAPVGAIYKFQKSGSAWTSTPVFLPGVQNNPLGLDPSLRIEMSIPDNEYLYAAVYNFWPVGAPEPTAACAVMRYSFSAQQGELVNDAPAWNLWQLIGSFEVSPLKVRPHPDSPEYYNIYAGGVHSYQSFDGGRTFVDIGGSCCTGSPTHGDIRGIFIHTPTTSLRGADDLVFFANDGGVSVKNGRDAQVWNTDATQAILGSGLTCATVWSVTSSEAGGMLFAGAQHEGMYAYEPDLPVPWAQFNNGDGTVTSFDEGGDKSKAYGSNQYANYEVTSSANGRKMGSFGGSGSFPEGNATSYRYPLWTSRNNNHYVGQKALYVRVGDSATWRNMSVGNPTAQLLPAYNTGLPYFDSTHILATAFDPHETDPKPVGYVSFKPAFKISEGPTTNNRKLYFRAPGGQFVPKAMPSAVTDQPMTAIALDPQNVNRVWIAIGGHVGSGSANKNRIFYSSNAGNSWTDVSHGLPDRMPITALVRQEGSENLYCATDVGTFKMDFSTYNPAAPLSNGVNTSAQWICFMKGRTTSDPEFPNIAVSQLNINYCSGNLYASTYGRSIWETPLWPYASNNPTPTIQITSNTTWNENKYLTSSVVVKTGATLTITTATGNSQTVIKMPSEGYIHVEPGATLNVSNSRITNGCKDCFWKGIEAAGKTQQTIGTNNPRVQSPQNAGTVIISGGSIIEHARTGVCNYAEVGGATDSAGGIIKISGSHFRNNRRSVYWAPYEANSSGNPNVAPRCRQGFCTPLHFRHRR